MDFKNQNKGGRIICDNCLNYQTLQCPCGIFNKNDKAIRYNFSFCSDCCDYIPNPQPEFEFTYKKKGKILRYIN